MLIYYLDSADFIRDIMIDYIQSALPQATIKAFHSVDEVLDGLEGQKPDILISTQLDNGHEVAVEWLRRFDGNPKDFILLTGTPNECQQKLTRNFLSQAHAIPKTNKAKLVETIAAKQRPQRIAS